MSSLCSKPNNASNSPPSSSSLSSPTDYLDRVYDTYCFFEDCETEGFCDVCILESDEQLTSRNQNDPDERLKEILKRQLNHDNYEKLMRFVKNKRNAKNDNQKSYERFENIDKSVFIANIAYIVSINGFALNAHRKLVKELSIIDVEKEKIVTFFFRVGEYDNLDAKMQRKVRLTQRYKHGMSFTDKSTDESQSNVYNILSYLCLEAKKRNKLIGFRGSSWEHRLLTYVGFGTMAMDLARLHCPPIRRLENYKFDWNVNDDCGNHEKYILDRKSKILRASPCTQTNCFYYYMYFKCLI